MQIERANELNQQEGSPTFADDQAHWLQFTTTLLERRFSDTSIADKFQRVVAPPRPRIIPEDQPTPLPYRPLQRGVKFLESLNTSLHLYVRDEEQTSGDRGDSRLTAAQNRLLTKMVEAHRRAEHRGLLRQGRGAFHLDAIATPGARPLRHPGFLGGPEQAYAHDLFALGQYHMLDEALVFKQDVFYDLTPAAFAYYETLKKRRSAPVERIEADVLGYLDAGALTTRYPLAYERWIAAEGLLWGPEAAQHLTDIGHRCREALIEFAKVLVDRYHPTPVNADATHARARISQTLQFLRAGMSETVNDYLGALANVVYRADELAQRQEHGAAREEKPLMWEDGRRLIFATLFAMTEIDQALAAIRQ